MAKASYAVRAHSAAPATVVFDVVAAADRWNERLPFRISRFEREGTPPPGGLGAIRCFGPGIGRPSREEVVLYEPPHRFSYTLLSGAIPLKRYRSDIVLTDDGTGGTDISWVGAGDSWMPGMGTLLTKMIGSFARKLAVEAERRLASNG
ncbi:MAG: SRPBCC family protein [Acidimicrobiia bacterium]